MATVDALMVGRFLYERNARDYSVDEDQMDQMWNVADVQAFWVAEATAVLGFIGYAEAK